MEQHGISKLDLKRRNRMQVLKILKQRGPTSRIDIAGTLELTRAAVTIITNEMIEQGIIAEIGEYKHTTEKAPRGRKKILIDINHHYKFALGIAIEEDVISVGLSTLSGAVLDKRNLPIDASTTREDIIEYIRTSINEVLNDNCLKKENILGIGFGIYPTMNARLGVDMSSGEPDYTKSEELIRKYTTLPIVIDNSVKGTSMANIDFQKSKDPNRHNIAFLQYGTNLNFVVTNLNDPIISYDNRTDFVDKMIIDPKSEEVCKCGRRGCAENEITPHAVVAKARKIFSRDKTPVLFELCGGDPSKITLDLVKEAKDQGDKGVYEVYETVTNLTAVLLNNLFFSTNPQKLVLHKFNITEQEFEHLIETVAKVASENVASKIELSIIEDKHRFLSGCALAIRELFFNRGGFDA
ncbi:MAG: ROK family protein [Ruminococcus sp.]|nr:ROK family protein [Ruminococcus sp.]